MPVSKYCPIVPLQNICMHQDKFSTLAADVQGFSESAVKTTSVTLTSDDLLSHSVVELHLSGAGLEDAVEVVRLSLEEEESQRMLASATELLIKLRCSVFTDWIHKNTESK